MDLGCRNILAAQSGHVRSGWFRAMPRVWSAVRMAPGIPIVSRVPVQPVKWHRVVMGCAVPTVQVDSSLKRRMPQNPTCFLVMFHVPKLAPKNGTWVLEKNKWVCCKSWRIPQNSHGISFMGKNLMSHYEWTDLVGSHCLVSELMGNLSRYIWFQLISISIEKEMGTNKCSLVLGNWMTRIFFIGFPRASQVAGCLGHDQPECERRPTDPGLVVRHSVLLRWEIYRKKWLGWALGSLEFEFLDVVV